MLGHHPRPIMTRLYATTLVATMLSIACSHGEPIGPLQHEHTVVNLDRAELSRIRLTMEAGELRVKGGAAKLAEADFTYNVAAWKPSVVQNLNRTPPELSITQATGVSTSGNTTNRWELALNDQQPLEIIAHLGAGEAHMTLGALNLRNVELTVGAGEVDMDLRGQPTTSYSVSIHGGVGTATVHLPSTVAISAKASGGLGDINVSGLEQRDGRWINPRATSSPVTIDLDVHGGIGEIRLEAE
jgi:hypothetical protein